ncbi:hypothetical protein KQL11_004817 [Salmonella enterica]|nr:hypothetical protein [Salmonella enterica]EIC4366404.1 hypothetical protein [Salmonella enterica]
MNNQICKITITSRHELLYFFWYIKSLDVRIGGFPKPSDDFDEWAEKINKAINSHCDEDYTSTNSFIVKMIDYFNDEKSLIDDIQFIRDNEITTMFAWLYIQQCHVRERRTIGKVQRIPLYNDMRLPSQSESHHERYEDICDYFYSGYLSKKEKISIIDSIQNTHSKIRGKIIPLHWLDERNDEQCKWACDYILQKYKPECIYVDIPDNTHERYLLTHGLFSLMVAIEHESEWRLFLTDINRAWSQKKHRASKKEQSPLNTYLDKKTKDKLKVLCVKEGVSIQTMLSHLIINEYDKMKR